MNNTEVMRIYVKIKLYCQITGEIMGSVRRVRVGFHLMSARFVKFKKMLTDVSLGSEIMRYSVHTSIAAAFSSSCSCLA